MTARDDIKSRAELFGWSVHADHNSDLFIHADTAILTTYDRDGTVRTGELYTFYSINDMQLRDRAPDRNKKTCVIAWLAEA